MARLGQGAWRVRETGKLTMLGPKKFRPYEVRILWGISLLLLGAAGGGIFLLISAGVAGLGALYLIATKRGQAL